MRHNDLPNHPDIESAMHTGYRRNMPTFVCPVCGSRDASYIYIKRRRGEALGCDICVERADIEDYACENDGLFSYADDIYKSIQEEELF